MEPIKVWATALGTADIYVEIWAKPVNKASAPKSTFEILITALYSVLVVTAPVKVL
jgi:hypothetical protein